MSRGLRVAFGAGLTLGVAAAAWQQESPHAAGGAALLVRGAIIWTAGPEGILEGADLLVRDGKIAGIGRDLRAPSGAQVIDATGKHITPGLIDCHSHTAVDGNVNEGSNNVTAEVRIGDVLDPEDIAIYRELAGGLTAANVLHGSANSIGGQNQVIKLKWGVGSEELKLAGAPPGIKFALGENPKRSNFSAPGAEPRYPVTRMGVEESIRERFMAARQYMKDWDDYNKLRSKEQGRRVPPRRDLQLEAIAEILRGERMVHSHSYRQDEILMLIRLAEEYGVHIATFQHVLEGYKVADEIARHGAGASTFSDWWAYKLEAHDAIPFNGALMTQRGVVVSFNSDSNELARRLNLEAAKAVKYGGLPEGEAIKLVTINPALQLGIDDRVGSLQAGKDADFVVWSGSPLSVYSLAEQTWVEGALQFDRARDIAGRAAVEARRKELIEKVIGGAGGGKPAGKTASPPAPGSPPASGDRPEGDPKPAPPATPEAAQPAAAPARPMPPARPAAWKDALSGTATGAVAIVGPTVHTVSGGEIAQGLVVFEDGVITQVGPAAGATAPAGATVIQAAGLHLYPGLIDADTTLGLTEIGSVAGSVDISETGRFNPNVHVEIAVNPESDLLPVTRANGLTHALTAPSGGILSGTSALIRLDGWTYEDLTAAAPLAMHAQYPALPGGPRGRFGGPQLSEEEIKKRRETDLKDLKALIESARAYRQARSAAVETLRPDPVMEAMLPMLEGTVPVIVEASEVRQIKEALAWAKQEGLRMILASSRDAWRAADLLKAQDVPVIVGPILSDSFRRDEPYDTAYSMPKLLHDAGVKFCITTGGGGFSAPNTRNLPYHAGMASAFGLPREEALRAVTLYPARILGVGDRLGSIEVGKSASLILTDGDPLEIRTKVLRVFIEGRPADLANKHQRLYDKYKSRPVSAPATSASKPAR